MTFPLLELKFSEVTRTPYGTTLVVRVYRVDDGGVSPDGARLYLRSLKRERTVTLGPGPSVPTIVTEARARLQAWAAELGYILPDDRLICSLS